MIKIIKGVLMVLVAFTASASVAQTHAIPDSIAICEPGDPDTVMDDTPSDSSASRLMTMEEIAVAADTIIANYDSDWKELSMQGKLSFTGLPMRVSVKVYMKRGESVILSARAPIFGEVARVEMCQDSIVFINKHTRTYNTQSFAGLTSDPKTYLFDFQDILLGQVAFPGNGRLTPDMALKSRWILMPEDNALIYPSAEFQVKGTEYGYVMDSTCWQLRTFVLMLQKAGIVVETSYVYGEEGWTLGLQISMKNKKLNGDVQLSYPDYEPMPLDFTELGDRYRRVDVKDLMKF